MVLLCGQVQGHVDDAVAKGATVTVGGKKPDLPEPYNKVGLPAAGYPQHVSLAGPIAPRQNANDALSDLQWREC